MEKLTLQNKRKYILKQRYKHEYKYKFFNQLFREIEVKKTFKVMLEELINVPKEIDKDINNAKIFQQFIDCAIEYLGEYLLLQKMGHIYHNVPSLSSEDEDIKNIKNIENIGHDIIINTNEISEGTIQYLMIVIFFYMWALFSFDEDYGDLSIKYFLDSLKNLPFESKEVKTEQKKLNENLALFASRIFKIPIPPKCSITYLYDIEHSDHRETESKSKIDDDTMIKGGEIWNDYLEYIRNKSSNSLWLEFPSLYHYIIFLINNIIQFPNELMRSSTTAGETKIENKISNHSKYFFKLLPFENDRDQNTIEYANCVVSVTQFLIKKYKLNTIFWSSAVIASLLWVWKKYNYHIKYRIEPNIERFAKLCKCEIDDISQFYKLLLLNEDDTPINMFPSIFPVSSTMMNKTNLNFAYFQNFIKPCNLLKI